MEEAFINGYCRGKNQTVVVCLELEGRGAGKADCDFGHCQFQENCPIAEKICELMSQQ